jgi:CRISPR-associated protein Csc3
MDNTLKDLLFQLGWEKRSLIQDYIEKIANKGLTRYKTIIQTGKKQGESLYTHILDGIFVFERLRPLLGVAEIEAKVIMTVYSVHDLNKVERFAGGGSYNKIGIKANFEEELRSVGMHEFFPEYQEYLEDITTLARAHSGHYHTDGELLIKSHNPYKLGKERIEDLKYVIRAMDVIDLSQTLTERTQKDKFLSELNTYLSKQTPVRQYEFHTHQVSENRGILTNLIHNRIAEYLEQQCGMLPLLFYPDGVAYLLEKGKPIPFTADDLKAIGQKVSASINRMTKSKFSTEFITSTQQGIKVDGKFRELGLTFEEIFTEIYNMVVGRIYQKRLADMVKKAKDRTVETMKKKAEKLKDQQEQDNSLQQAIEIAQLTAIMPDSDEGMRVGELLRSYYIFLSTHYEKEIPNTWDYLYTLLDIETSRRQFYDAFDPRYDRPYVVAKDLTMSLDEMKTFIIEAGNKLATTSVVQPQEDLIHEETPIEKYVCRHVNFNFMLPQKAQFLENLKVYLNNPGSQCCYCGSAFDTDKWMSADVPGDVKVQYFSNRLEGGQREPKRHICEICNTQFILYKLNYPTISPGNLKKQGVNTYYLHLFPYAFYPEMFLQALRTTINRLKGLEVESLYLKGESAIREYMKSSTVELKFSKAKVNGFPLPKFTEVQGNMLLFPVNCMGDNESERFLFAVENALLMQKYLGCKVVLTDSSVGIVEQSEFDDLYIDSIPATFRKMIWGECGNA